MDFKVNGAGAVVSRDAEAALSGALPPFSHADRFDRKWF